ncbi:Ribosomal RNA small subunit methyltransferase C [Pseudomonas fluorescens]|uniref:class I SAM-dependent methyltransferase n=1 Tax=Pseudomonas fluorescens TaxID=294 RepID=UPI001258A0B8|nr:class I SAM-dependent methyltransferase [Pseudomonas fluorescens]CAG8868027.1 Ribosomal RNA small subunit methyltransferase C [Pseudomonas fluorescens]VVP97067.1 Ribosomal RNA small subunit methyltransferase C [Pseudomonas fluorescens]
MDPRSEVLLRQAELFQGPVLLTGLPADDLFGQLPQASGWSWHAGDQALLDSRFAGQSHYGVTVPEVAFDAAVLFMPKSRDLATYLLDALAARLAGRELYLVGEKRGGIEGGAKLLQAYGKPRKLDSARHCQLWQVTVENVPDARPLESLAERFELPLADGPLQVVTLPGVFSHGRLDKGTALLLEHLDNLPVGDVLDFGCGAGVLGATVKRRYPESRVTLLDVDAFAVASSRLTLEANGLEGEVLSGDGIDAAPMDLVLILSNPPFHTGVHTHYQTSETLLKKSREHLRKGGQLRLVANSFLRYKPLIEEALGNCETRVEAQGFKIYQATRG